MNKRWPVLDRSMPSYFTVDAPADMVDYDSIEIKVQITPTYSDRPVTQLYQSVWITRIEARDQRAIGYITRQMIDGLMRAWWTGEDGK